MNERANGWARKTIAGFRSMGASRYFEAGQEWASARLELDLAATHDPRIGAALANAGLGLALGGEPSKADALLADAEQLWMRLLRLAETSDLALAGGSSAFQFRLAANSLAVFQTIQRTRLQRQCEAALVMTRFNRLAISSAISAEAIAPTLGALLSEVNGARAPEVRLLHLEHEPHSASADAPYADKADELDRQFGGVAAWPTDIWQLVRPALSFQALIRTAVMARTDQSAASGAASPRSPELSANRR